MAAGGSQEENRQQVVEEGGSNLQRGQRKGLPHNYYAIIKEADAPLTDHDQLKSGVFLNQKRKKYWIDEKTGANCFMLFARGLQIEWSSTPNYWSWCPVKETSDVEVEVAKLRQVWYLQVIGQFQTSDLSPYTTYEVLFVVMIDEKAPGWSYPLSLELQCPDGNVQVRRESMELKARKQWMELHVGDFRTSMGKGGAVRFTLLNDSSVCKRGLVVKGAVIRPKKSV